MPKENEQSVWGWAGDTPKQARQYYEGLWKRYKINREHFEQFWVAQNGRCVCSREFAHPTRRQGLQMGYEPRVDHKHLKDQNGNEIPCETKDVRGLLCARCNRVLGVLRDNIDVLAGLLAHLQRHGDLQL